MWKQFENKWKQVNSKFHLETRLLALIWQSYQNGLSSKTKGTCWSYISHDYREENVLMWLLSVSVDPPKLQEQHQNNTLRERCSQLIYSDRGSFCEIAWWVWENHKFITRNEINLILLSWVGWDGFGTLPLLLDFPMTTESKATFMRKYCAVF